MQVTGNVPTQIFISTHEQVRITVETLRKVYDIPKSLSYPRVIDGQLMHEVCSHGSGLDEAYRDATDMDAIVLKMINKLESSETQKCL